MSKAPVSRDFSVLVTLVSFDGNKLEIKQISQDCPIKRLQKVNTAIGSTTISYIFLRSSHTAPEEQIERVGEYNTKVKETGARIFGQLLLSCD